MCDTVIYLGPTLARADAERILAAEYLPPIRRGDLARLPEEVQFVGIIDGEFFQSLAVSPKEVVALLRRGVTVCGASSMGALRAAETHKLGTIGVGQVFAMFRDGLLDADDEVALTYDPETFRKLSEPLVNLRCAVAMAATDGMISCEERDDLLAQMKSLYFPERSYRALEMLCPRLTAYFTSIPRPDPKRDDAIALLNVIRDMRETGLNPKNPAIGMLSDQTSTPLSSA
jgi:TfuA protein